MCFSAEASFGASGILFLMGSASISKVTKPSQFMLACTPMIFSLQQISEGVLWLNLDQHGPLMSQTIATYTFVLFGQSLWPIWVPMANYLVEEKTTNKKILLGMVGIGVFISTYLFYNTLSHPIDVKVAEHHIHYGFTYPQTLVDNFSWMYLIPTVCSHFVSSIREINLLGLFTLFSYIISQIFFTNYVFSVWCFFAAILSVWIYVIVKAMSSKGLLSFIPLSNRFH